MPAILRLSVDPSVDGEVGWTGEEGSNLIVKDGNIPACPPKMAKS